MVEERDVLKLDDPLDNLFQTVWKDEGLSGEPSGAPRYVIASMSGWGYNGPEDAEDVFELELECSAQDHPVIRQFYVDRGLEGSHNWPRIIGTHRDGIMRTQRQPRAMLLCFESEQAREEFKEYWSCLKK